MSASAEGPLRTGTAIGGAIGVGFIALVLPDVALTIAALRGITILDPTGLPFSLLALTVVARQSALLLGALGVIFFATRGGWRALGFHTVEPGVVLASMLAVLGLGPASDAIVRVVRFFAPELEIGVLDQIASVALAQPLYVLIPLFALLPGLAEEAYFRGLVQRIAGRGAFAIATSALIFALFHIDPIQAVGVLPIGLFLAWLRDRTGSLVPPIAAHIANNTIALVATRALPTIDPAVASAPTPPLIVVVGLGATAALMVFISAHSPPRTAGR